MQFLRTLLWVVLAVVIVLFARENWFPVTIGLWSGLQADVKLPVLVGAAFLLGFVPTYLVMRGRLWTLQRRLGQSARANVANRPAAMPPPPPSQAGAPNLAKPAASPNA